jgi:uncharacterized OB-fold protein
VIEDAPLPDLDADSAPFWQGCADGELRIQACASCGARRFPPRPMCPGCSSLESRWEVVGTTGTVWSVVVPHPPLLPAFMPFAPYNVVIVTLDDDPAIRLPGNVVAAEGAAINSVDPATIEIGAAVRVVFDRVADDVALPRWVLT